MKDSFAVFASGSGQPAAVFSVLEEAIEWALRRFGSGGFRIKGYPVLVAPPARPALRASN
jgi:hypothetical protein